MKNINRFTEPENMIDQSGSLKLKWFALIAAVGIALLFFLSGCNESSKAEAAKVNSMGTYTYDSCEYVGMNLSWGSAVLVHKGNCKYCIQRKGGLIK